MRVLNGIRNTVLIAIAWTFLAATPGLSAEPADRAWQLRVSGLTIDSGVETEWVAGEDSARFRSETGGGITAAIEYVFSSNVGIEIGAILGETDLEVSGIEWRNGRVIHERADFGFRAHTIALNVHLNPDQPVEIYVAPTIARIDFYRLRYDQVDSTSHRHSVEAEAGSETAWGATVGIDVPVRQSDWSISGTIRYLRAGFRVGNWAQRIVNEAEFEPLMIGVGFRYSF